MRPRLRRRIALGTGVTTVLLVAATVAVHRVAESRWEEMQDLVAERTRAWEARDFSRPVLWGEATPGNAFVHYEEANRIAAELNGRRGEQSLLVALLHRPETLAEDDVQALRSRWRPAIDAMREGAHRSDARPDRSIDEWLDAEPTNLLAGRWIANMSCVETRLLLDEGRAAEAVGYTLDAAAYGADFADAPLLIDQMIGLALVAIATREFWDQERLAKLDEPGAALLAAGLERLDARMEVTARLDGEALYLAHWMSRASSLDELELPALSAWSYGFSSRWMMADAVLQIDATVDRLARSSTLPWPARQCELQREADLLSSSRNPIVIVSWAGVPFAAERTKRLIVAQLRMLRVAVDARLGRPLPELEDPLGDGPLEVAETASGTRIRSDGRLRDAPLEWTVPHPTPR